MYSSKNKQNAAAIGDNFMAQAMSTPNGAKQF